MIHTIPIRVYYEDTDAGGIVYHASYVRYAERGRTEYLRHAGFVHKSLIADSGVQFVVRRMEIDYFAPALLDDALEVHTSIRSMRRTSFVMRQSVMRDGIEICRLEVIVVSVNREGRPTMIPDAMRAVFEKQIVTDKEDTKP